MCIIKSIHTSGTEGRFDESVTYNANGTPTCWNYYVTDHLGSTRMIVDSNDSIKEVINYFFGL